MIKKLLLSALFTLLPQLGNAAMSLQFSTSSSTLNNIANSSSVVSNGLLWGILVDRNSVGFGAALLGVGLSLNDTSEIAPGFNFFIGGTTNEPPFGTDFKGPGTIGTTTGDLAPALSSVPGITLSSNGSDPFNPTGSDFALIWFDTGVGNTAGTDSLEAGDKYGLLTNGGFKLPSDGKDPEPYLFFTGEDGIRPANLAVIPEPGTALLAFLSLAGLLRRKR